MTEMMAAMLVYFPQKTVINVDSLQNEDDDCCDPPHTETTTTLVVDLPQTAAMVFDPLQTMVKMVVNLPQMVVAKNIFMFMGQVLKDWFLLHPFPSNLLV